MEQLHSGFLSERSWGGGGWCGCWFGVEVTPHHWGAPGWAPMGAPRLPDVAQRGLTECTALPLNPGKGTQKNLFARGRGTIASPFPTQRELGGSPARGSPCSHFTPTPAARGAQPGSGASSSQLETQGKDTKRTRAPKCGPSCAVGQSQGERPRGARLGSAHPRARCHSTQLLLLSPQSCSSFWRAGRARPGLDLAPFVSAPTACCGEFHPVPSPSSSVFFLSPFGLSARVCT